VSNETALNQPAPRIADIPPLAERAMLPQIELPARGGQVPAQRIERSPAPFTRSAESTGCDRDVEPIVDQAILREALRVGLK
jgi:hypothetical protein